MNKTLFIETISNEIEEHLKIVISQLQNLPENTLTKPAINGGWSIAECIAHLNTYGYFYLPKIKNAIALNKNNTSNTIAKNTWLGNYFIKTMRADAKLKKYKAFKGHIPAKNLNPYAELAEFISQNETLLQLVEAASTTNTNQIKIGISLTKFIRINLNDLFGFIVAHNNRHLLQALKNV